MIGHKMSDRDTIALLADINEALDEDNEALKKELKRYKKALEYARDEVYKLIPGEHTQEHAEEYYERVTEGELPNLYDYLLKEIAELEEGAE